MDISRIRGPLVVADLVSILNELIIEINAINARTVIEEATTFYVRLDGSDSNNGLTNTPTGAFRTVQFAYDFIVANYYFAADVTIQLGNGTFPGVTFLVPWVGTGNLTLKGNGAANTTMDGTGEVNIDAFTNVACLPARFIIDAMTLTSATGHCVNNSGVGTVQINSGITFSTAQDFHILAGGGPAVVAPSGDYTISGNAKAHLYADAGWICDSLIDTAPSITLTGTPSFSVAFAVSEANGNLEMTRTTYIGSATGKRAETIAGYIKTLSLTTFPGDTPVDIQTHGGVYAVSDVNVYEANGRDAWTGANGSFGMDGTTFGMVVSNASGLGWAAVPFVNAFGTTPFDTGWMRDGQFQIGQRNGTNPQKQSVYKTFTDATTLERLSFDAGQSTANVFRIMAEKGSVGGALNIIAVDGFNKAGAPANTDLPAGTWALLNDTSGGNTWLIYNNGGTIRKVQLT